MIKNFFYLSATVPLHIVSPLSLFFLPVDFLCLSEEQRVLHFSSIFLFSVFGMRKKGSNLRDIYIVLVVTNGSCCDFFSEMLTSWSI
ncbi:hypothetical protein J1N35_020357 [Gossypium stocksii]|uniref:Uncharacterized protein n=1 Tax=Gossypium stocksii TaxID=47602 RepID=A0A9D3VD32_9ROSI|nr:hypothetical protein J1N35_020357 [Gossypium stocksii]